MQDDNFVLFRILWEVQVQVHWSSGPVVQWSSGIGPVVQWSSGPGPVAKQLQIAGWGEIVNTAKLWHLISFTASTISESSRISSTDSCPS